jgi:hypothetical protein
MRRTLAIALIAFAVAGTATAETWTKYIDSDNGVNWSYDADYLYKDKATGRVVVMQAIAKPSANLGPSAPGKPDGVGSVVAIDCAKKNLIPMGSYTPSSPLDIKGSWRSDTPKRAGGPENEALIKTVCAVQNIPLK